MNFYPNTPVYIVSYWPGTSGTFVKSLLQMFILSESNGLLSEHGNMHSNNFNSNWKIVGSDGPQFLAVDPIDPAKPLFFSEHVYPNMDQILYKYPKAKVVLIQYTKDSRPLVECNLFYKVFIDGWANPYIKQQWDEIKEKYFQNINDPRQVPKNLIQKFLNRPASVPEEFRVGFSFQNEESLYKIKFEDILNDKNNVLNILSNITGKAPTKEITSFYENYLIKQEDLHSKMLA